GQREHQLSDALGSERVRGQTTCFGVDRASCRERGGQGGSALRLNADYAGASSEPCRDSADQPAAAYRDEQRVNIRSLLFEFEPHCALAQHGFGLIVSMDWQRSGLSRPLF